MTITTVHYVSAINVCVSLSHTHIHTHARTKALQDVVAPEEKRRIIGDTFVRVAEAAIAQLGVSSADVFLAQGTLRPDLIESASALARQATH